MPNGMINATKWNDTLYDIHDKRISDNNITDWDGKYEKPQGGIPKTDLESTVQTSLGKADTALQSVPSGYATETYVSSVIATAAPTSGTLILPSTGLSWTDNQDGTYSQFVVIPDGTANTKVDLQVDGLTFNQMLTDKITALYVVNNNGVFNAIAVGNEPSDTITVQYTKYEVVIPS